MRQEGRCITGDPIRVGSFTADWMSVRLHPTTFFCRYDQFQEGFDKVKGFYAELDMGQFVLLRFSHKEDVTAFHRMHHEYI